MGAGPGSLFDHWSPWPHLKGLNLSVDLLKDFFWGRLTGVDVDWELSREWRCCGESDGAVFPPEWRYRGVMSPEGVRIHVCAQVYANFVQAAVYFPDCLTTDTHTSVNFAIKVYIGLPHPRSRFCCLAQACLSCSEVLLCNSWCRLICIMLFRQMCLHSFSPFSFLPFKAVVV